MDAGLTWMSVIIEYVTWLREKLNNNLGIGSFRWLNSNRRAYLISARPPEKWFDYADYKVELDNCNAFEQKWQLAMWVWTLGGKCSKCIEHNAAVVQGHFKLPTIWRTEVFFPDITVIKWEICANEWSKSGSEMAPSIEIVYRKLSRPSHLSRSDNRNISKKNHLWVMQQLSWAYFGGTNVIRHVEISFLWLRIWYFQLA